MLVMLYIYVLSTTNKQRAHRPSIASHSQHTSYQLFVDKLNSEQTSEKY